MKKSLKKMIIVVMIVVMALAGTIPASVKAAETTYITREEFVKLVIKELKIKVDEKSSEHPYIDAAIRAGIMSKSTFGTDYNKYLTKSDAAVILVNADIYLHGDTVPEKLLNVIQEKRISDLASVSKARRVYVAKAYALGFLIGTSDGTYTKSRSLKVSQKVSTATAKNLVKMLNDKSKRYQITDDGQLIRTTNLPEFAEYYPYILADFPNSYYDWEFSYMQWQNSSGKPLYGIMDPDNYASPKDYFKSEKRVDETVEIWNEKVEKYLNLVFNVDYRKLEKGNAWYNGVLETLWNNRGMERKSTWLDKYIDAAIENKTIVESKLIGFDASTLYKAVPSTYMRVHVKYRIVSSKSLERTMLSPIIFTYYTYPNIKNVKLGEWRDAYFDIEVSSYDYDFGIREALIDDYFHDNRVVIK